MSGSDADHSSEPAGPGWDSVGSDSAASAGEEALRLLAAAEQWARSRTGGLLDGLSDGLSDGLGRLDALRRLDGRLGVRPETVAHLQAAAGSLAAALRSAVGPSGGPSTAAGPEAPPDTPAPARVQRIDVVDDGP